MKKAKVSKGFIQHVWPWEKTLHDGTKITKELPKQYNGLNGKEVPECIIDVPDEVQPGWAWNETLQRYAPRIKIPFTPPKSTLLELLAEKLGMDYNALFDELKQKKLDFKQQSIQKAEGVVANVELQLVQAFQKHDNNEIDINTIVNKSGAVINEKLSEVVDPVSIEETIKNEETTIK